MSNKNLLPFAIGTLLRVALALFATPVEGIEKTEEVEKIRFTPYDFEASSGEVVAAELGEMWVPERRGTDGRRIKLQLMRFASTSKTPGAPIIYLAGGPGGSGIDTARGRRFPLFMALRGHADVIVLDQRGTGLSSSIEPCEPETRYPLDKPLEREPLLRALGLMSRECAAQWRDQGVDLDGYNTIESAHDIEHLRRGLGVPKVSLWGISYGTHLVFAALRYHPESIQSVVLASAEGPDETIKLPSRTQSFLEHLDVLTQADPELQTMRRVLDRLAKEPAAVEISDPRGGGTVKVGIGKLDVQILTGLMIKNPDTQAHIPLLYAALDSGDYARVAPYVLRLRRHFKAMGGMSEAMDAASSMSPERRARVLAERDQALLGDILNWPVLPDWSFSEALGVTELPASFRAPLRSDVPALFLSGTLDGRTYPASHRQLAAGFSRATFVPVEGAGHDLFMASPAVEERILDFLNREVTSEQPIRVATSTNPTKPRNRAGSTPPTSLPAAHEKALDQFIQQFVDLAMFDGRVVIDIGGEVVYERSFGLAHYELGLPHQPETRFRIASVSKLVTDVAVARFMETGKLHLDSKVAAYLPSFPAGDRITLGQLLNHTSGIPHTNHQSWGDGKISLSLDQIIGRLGELPLAFPPGTKTAYSNGGYAVLAKILEVVGEGSFAEVLRAEVFDPLGMKNTDHIADARAPIEGIATGYEPGPFPGERRHSRFYACETRPGGGSLFSTTGDLLRLLRGVFREDFVTPALRRDVLGADDGPFLSQGRAPGFVGKAYYDAEPDLIVVSLSNSYAVPADWGQALADLATRGSLSDPWPELAPVSESVDPAGPGPGTYRSGHGREFAMTRTARGALVVENTASESITALVPLADGSWLQPLYFQRCEWRSQSSTLTCAMLSGNPAYTSEAKRTGD